MCTRALSGSSVRFGMGTPFSTKCPFSISNQLHDLLGRAVRQLQPGGIDLLRCPSCQGVRQAADRVDVKQQAVVRPCNLDRAG